MNSGDPSLTELLDDYFSESEEHLVAIRRHLLTMESSENGSAIDHGAVDEMLLALHSLKGLSGMAGVQAAEQVAHAMEGFLRRLTEVGGGPSEGVMATLTAGAESLEQIIAARREERALPDVQEVLSMMATLPLAPARRWHFHFCPTAELSARGINVNSVRDRIRNVGRILSTTPHILNGGQIEFQFVVESGLDASHFHAWPDDGISATVEEQAEAISATASIADVPAPSSTYVRVEMGRLDELMTMAGEMVISRGQVTESLRRLESSMPSAAWRELQEANLHLQRQLRGLKESVMRVRMVPIGQIFERMRFVARGLERESRKEIVLELSGHETEIDKVLVERMMDPLLHLVRNAVSHGLESPDERIAAGKTRKGHLRIHARTEGETVVVELEDDGRGVDLDSVASRAIAMGLLAEGEALGPERILHTICAPGFSTRAEADLAAGRGVGLAVVTKTIASLGGTLAMETHAGQGTRFTMRLPLTLAIIQALIVYVNDQAFAVPRSSVHEVLRVEPGMATVIDDREVVPCRNGNLPVVRLRQLFGMAERPGAAFHVLSTGLNRVGIAVDRIAGQREIVVRSTRDPLVRVAGIAGVTEIGDGRPILILDVAAIVEAAHTGHPLKALPATRSVDPPRAPQTPAETAAAESLVLFELDGATWGVRSGAVQAVEMPGIIAAVPNALPYLEGVTFTRGQVIPSINLRGRMGLPKVAIDRGTRMLVIRSDDRSAGLLVDGAREFVSAPANAFRPHGDEDKVMDLRYVEGVATIGKRSVLILNLDEVLHGV